MPHSHEPNPTPEPQPNEGHLPEAVHIPLVSRGNDPSKSHTRGYGFMEMIEESYPSAAATSSVRNRLTTRDSSAFAANHQRALETNQAPKAPELPLRVADERAPEYLSRLFEMSPEEKAGFYQTLDEKGRELGKLHFDDPERLADIKDAQEYLSWIYDGSVNRLVPDVLTPTDTTGKLHLTGPDYHLTLSDLDRMVAGYTKRSRELLARNEEVLRRVFKEHLEASDCYQLLQSFGEAVSRKDERPLSAYERLIREQQILGEVANQSLLQPQDVQRPLLSDELHASAANHTYRRQTSMLDEERVITTVSEPATKDNALDKLKDYFRPILQATYADLYIAPGETAPEPEAMANNYYAVFNKVREAVLGNRWETNENRLLSKMLKLAYGRVGQGGRDFQELLDNVTRHVVDVEADRLAEFNHHAIGMSPNSLQTFIWQFREPVIPEGWVDRRGQEHHKSLIGGLHRMGGLHSQHSASLAGRREVESTMVMRYGEAFLDDRTAAEQRQAKRIIMSVPVGLIEQKMPADAKPTLGIRLAAEALKRRIGVGHEPYIVGYQLLARHRSEDSEYFDFARLPDENPYEPCLAPINSDQQRQLHHLFMQQGLTKLAEGLDQGQVNTIEDLRRLLQATNVFYVPEQAVEQAMVVRDGRAYLQCDGAEALCTEALNAITPKSARRIRGLPLNTDGVIPAAGHRATLHMSEGRLFVIDATPSRIQNATQALPLLSRQPEPELHATKPEAAREASSPEVSKQTAGPPEVDPLVQARTDIQQATTSLKKAHQTFEEAARVRLGIEGDAAYATTEALYSMLVSMTTDSDPLRQTWRHLAYALPHTFGTPAYEATGEQLAEHMLEAQQILDYLGNLKKMSPAERQSIGVEVGDTALDSFSRILTSAKYSYRKLAKARQIIGSQV